jgi:AcrR family transcriptional regulator
MAATKVRPRTKPPEQRRDDLMNAAQRLFVQNGVAPTTIDQISAAAGVAKGTFYLYFSSKEHVLTALGDRFSQQLVSELEAAVAGKDAGDCKGKLAAWMRTATLAYLASMRLHDVVFRESAAHAREDFAGNGTIGHLLRLLEDGVAAGAWTLDDPWRTAVFLYSGLHGVVDDTSSKPKATSGKRIAESMARIALRTVGLR